MITVAEDGRDHWSSVRRSSSLGGRPRTGEPAAAAQRGFDLGARCRNFLQTWPGNIVIGKVCGELNPDSMFVVSEFQEMHFGGISASLISADVCFFLCRYLLPV